MNWGVTICFFFLSVFLNFFYPNKCEDFHCGYLTVSFFFFIGKKTVFFNFFLQTNVRISLVVT